MRGKVAAQSLGPRKIDRHARRGPQPARSDAGVDCAASQADDAAGQRIAQLALLMIALIWSELKARNVVVRTLPSDPAWSKNAVAVSSSGKSAMETTSYGPTVQKLSRILPPRRSAASPAALARPTAFLKSPIPLSVQLMRTIYVAMRLTFPAWLRSDAPDVLGS